MKILVCEDDPVVLKTMEVALSLEGDDIHLANNGEKALDLLGKNDYSLIFTDIHMPYATGADVLDFVHKQQGKKTPIVIISSDNDEEVVSMAKKMGVHAFLSKPVNVDKVRKIVKDLRPRQ